MAGVAGAAVGISGGLGGLLAACGEEAETTTTTAAGGETTTTAAGGETTTTASADVEMGDEVKVGFVTPLTGGLASFGVPDKYCVDRWNEYIGDGVVGGDNKKHPVKIDVQDSQSDVARAAQVAGDLINNTSIDLMMVAPHPRHGHPPGRGTVRGERVPCVSTDWPVAAYLGQNMETGYKWSYHVFFGGEDWIIENWAVYEKIASNKKIVAMFDNTADGLFFSRGDPALHVRTRATPSWIPVASSRTEDFTSQIRRLQERRRGADQRQHDPAGLHQLLEGAAQQGLSVKGVMIGQVPAVPAVC